MQAKEPTPPAASTDARPNILLFLVDDLGWNDTSEPFWKDTTWQNRTYRTPNIQRLARQSVKFTQAYASPVSSPSRVSLLTGMSPAAHRVTNWTLRQGEMPDPVDSLLSFPAWNVNGIAAEAGFPATTHVTALPQILRDNGYRTILVGKAHFGAIGTPGADPATLGFEVNVAGHAAGGLASYLGERNYGNDPSADKQSPFAVPGMEAYWGSRTFLTEALTREAIRTIDQSAADGKPFFLYMSLYAVHVPFDRDARFYQSYIEGGLSPTEAAYAALIEGVDRSLGDLMDHLRERGLDRNTIVLFLSDNGGLAAWNRTADPRFVNWPLRSGKGSPMEGGVRIPLLIAQPGVTDSGAVCTTPIAIEDLMPTLLEVGGVRHPRSVQRIDGKSLVPLLAGGTLRPRALTGHYPNAWDASGEGIGAHSWIRAGDWKLIYYYGTGQVCLFNLAEDIHERIDHGMNPRQALRRKRMLRSLSRSLKQSDAQLPYLKRQDRWCDYPDGSRYTPRDQ